LPDLPQAKLLQHKLDTSGGLSHGAWGARVRGFLAELCCQAHTQRPTVREAMYCSALNSTGTNIENRQTLPHIKAAHLSTSSPTTKSAWP
jgi:hypothetical protein